MEFDLFAFLNGISPWYWVTFAVALATLEMATMSFFLIWPAIAALIMGGVIAASPNMDGTWQVVTFAVLSVVLTFAGRSLLKNFGDGGEENATLNQRGNHFVGRMGKTLECTAGVGAVEVEGMRWRAMWSDGQISEPGEMVRILSADGMTLNVEPTR